jgi:hypothetical protein
MMPVPMPNNITADYIRKAASWQPDELRSLVRHYGKQQLLDALRQTKPVTEAKANNQEVTEKQ